jgi:MEMO1 family protein
MPSPVSSKVTIVEANDFLRTSGLRRQAAEAVLHYNPIVSEARTRAPRSRPNDYRVRFAIKRIRRPAVAGMFYPGDAQELARDVDKMLREARVRKSALGPLPKAIIVPHAGYVYSGPIAASAYAQLESGRGVISRVVLLGPVHRVPVQGLALPDADTDSFATPLGAIPVDAEALRAIRSLPQMVQSDSAHATEHSLEVQLPFLQAALGDFKLVPLAVGDAGTEDVAEVLDLLWGGNETLIVVSSDLSHYLPYSMAREMDAQTVQQVLDLSADIRHDQACGGTPVNGLLLTARRHGLAPRLLDIRNSGDTAGDRSSVVGYAAFAFTQAPNIH